MSITYTYSCDSCGVHEPETPRSVIPKNWSRYWVSQDNGGIFLSNAPHPPLLLLCPKCIDEGQSEKGLAVIIKVPKETK